MPVGWTETDKERKWKIPHKLICLMTTLLYSEETQADYSNDRIESNKTKTQVKLRQCNNEATVCNAETKKLH